MFRKSIVKKTHEIINDMKSTKKLLYRYCDMNKRVLHFIPYNLCLQVLQLGCNQSRLVMTVTCRATVINDLDKKRNGDSTTTLLQFLYRHPNTIKSFTLNPVV